MTLDELDNALRKLGLNLDTEEGMKIRNDILREYGLSVISNVNTICSGCWFRNNRGCDDKCKYNGIKQKDSLNSALQYLESPNNVDLMMFILAYVIPMYEKVTGNKGIIENIEKEFNRKWNEYHPSWK